MGMKLAKVLRKAIVGICCISLLSPAQAMVFAADISALSKTGVTVSDPFALMYDSDELLLEKAEPILSIAEIEREDVQ